MQVSTDSGWAVESVLGFVPRVLRDAEVGLFRAEERVFDAMLDGWRAQMLARGLATETIDGRCGVLRRFQERPRETRGRHHEQRLPEPRLRSRLAPNTAGRSLT